MGGLAGPGSSIAVLGTGLDMIYPASNRDIWRELTDKGLILSEFGPGSKPVGRNFPQRNRIISGLALGVLVVEARAKSGSLITARLAMEQGREVFAVPGPVSLPSYRGCHELINQGAKLVHNAGEILVELKAHLEAFVRHAKSVQAPPRPRPVPVQARLDAGEGDAPVESAKPAKLRASRRRAGPVADDPGPEPPQPGQPGPSGHGETLEEAVTGHLAAMGPSHVDTLGRALGVAPGEMSAALVVLEMKGVVARLPGMYYTLA